MPAATPSPAPAIRTPIRTASVIGSWRSGAGRAGSRRAPAAVFGLAAADRAVEGVFRAARAPADAFPRAGGLDPPRLSLRRPGRERGRFPITPGSSVTFRPRE